MTLNNIKEYFIDRFVRRFTAAKEEPSDTTTKPSELTLKDVMMKLEPILASLQSLMIWDKPYLSAIAFIVFNITYWLFVCFNRFRFYAFIFLALFCINFLKLWTQYIWPEIRVTPSESTDTEGWIPVHPQVLSAPEINYYINELCVLSKALFLWFVKLRREKKFKFCLLINSIFVMTAIIGRLVPGVVIVYSIIMTMALGPGVVLYVFPDGLYELLRNFFISNQNNDESDDKNEKKDDITERELLSESALHQYLIKTDSFKDFDVSSLSNDDSSLQLLSDTQLDITLDKEIGIEAQLSDDDLKLDSLSNRSSHSSGSRSSAIRFVTTHFSRHSSSDNIEDEFELISDSELRESTPKGSQYAKNKNK